MYGSVQRPEACPDGFVADLLAIARDCGRLAAEVLLQHVAAPARAVQTKSGPNDLVSAADLASEDAIRSLLARRRPDDGILGEERPELPARSGLRWVIDPLDGTRNYLQRIPHWAVSVACEDRDGAVVAVVVDAERDECFTAARGCGAWLDGRRLTGSAVTELRVATVGGEYSARTATQAERSQRLLTHAGGVRNYGAAALDLAWAAAGRFDAVYHGRFPAPWDVAAGALLCREAGVGVECIGDGDEEPLMLAAAPALMEQLTALLGAG
jgi:myo-inositol-1(or 4)-monophosphatase